MEDDKKAAHVKVRRSVGMIVSVGCWVFFFASAATLSTCFSGPVDMCHVSCVMSCHRPPFRLLPWMPPS